MIALLFLACADSSAPDLAFRVARSELDLGRAEWSTIELPSADLSILNLSEQTLLVTPLGFDGDGAGALVWREFADYTEVFAGDTVTLIVTLSSDPDDWVGGVFSSTLRVEVGAAWNDPSDFDLELQWIEERLTIPVSYELDCDLDDDGVDAPACGGADCDDDPLVISGTCP
jgi:hypothetical protein